MDHRFIFSFISHNNSGDTMETEYEILDYIYKNACMGYESTMTLLKGLEDKENKIKEVVTDILNSYGDFTKQSELLLCKINADGKKYNFMATMSANTNIKRKVNKDNSDAAIAQMLIKGLSMGQNNMAKAFENINKNDVDKKVLTILESFKEFQINAMKKLEKYV